MTVNIADITRTLAHAKIPIQGYTLIELLLVMAIMGMAMALVIPRFSSTQSAILKAQSREVVAILKQARRTAIMEGRQVQAVLQSQTEATPTTVDHHNPPAPVSPHSKSWRSEAEVTLQWSDDKIAKSDHTVVSAATAGGHYSFTFYPEGGSSGGDLILSYKEQRVKIKVNPLTGKIATEFLNRENH